MTTTTTIITNTPAHMTTAEVTRLTTILTQTWAEVALHDDPEGISTATIWSLMAQRDRNTQGWDGSREDAEAMEDAGVLNTADWDDAAWEDWTDMVSTAAAALLEANPSWEQMALQEEGLA